MKCVWSGRYLYVKAFVTKMACVYSWCSMRARGLDVFWFVAAVAKFISQVWNQPFSFTRHDLKVSFQDWRCPEEGCFISEVSENSQLSAILFLKAFRAKPFFFFFLVLLFRESFPSELLNPATSTARGNALLVSDGSDLHPKGLPGAGSPEVVRALLTADVGW